MALKGSKYRTELFATEQLGDFKRRLKNDALFEMEVTQGGLALEKPMCTLLKEIQRMYRLHRAHQGDTTNGDAVAESA